MVQWLRQMALDQEVVDSNPSTVYWMDVSDLQANTLQKKLKIKVAKQSTPKIIKKKLILIDIEKPKVTVVSGNWKQKTL